MSASADRLRARLIRIANTTLLMERPMMRHEFDTYFAANCSSTDMQFPETELRRINDCVFAAVQNLDVEGWGTKSAVDHAFEEEFMKLRTS